MDSYCFKIFENHNDKKDILKIFRIKNEINAIKTVYNAMDHLSMID